MNREYKEKLSGKIERNFSELEERIMQDVVRRIKKTGKITSTADWQINRLRILGHSSEDIEQMLKEALEASYPEMFELYDQVIDWEYVRNKDIYEQVNAEYIPFEENKELQQITESLVRQSGEELENITHSLGFYLDYGNGQKVLTPLAEVYQKYLDGACMDIVSGAFDYNSVLRRVVTDMTNSGLRKIDYASGRAYRVNTAARMAVMTGITQLTGHISDMNAEKLGTDYFEIAWHAGARPTHRVWQGRVWSRKQLVTVCGLGTVTGLEGANCYHERYPFIPGISERNWTDEWLKQQDKKEDEPKEFQGKTYTLYEAKQRQRQMETAMRAQREKVQLLKEGGADPDDVMLARAKYQGQLNEYSRFCKKMGLPEERERIYYDMRGRVAPYRRTSDRNKIRKEERKKRAGAGASITYKNEPVDFDPGNDYGIEIPEFSEKVNAGLSEAAMDVAKRGGTDGFEHMHLVNLKTGELEYYETNEEAGSVGVNFWKYVEEHPDTDFAFVHNHNIVSSLSQSDLETPILKQNVPVMIAVQNDGVKYIAVRSKDSVSGFYPDFYYESALEELNKQSRSGKITPTERMKKREEIMIQCMLDEFYEKGMVIIDGRKSK